MSPTQRKYYREYRNKENYMKKKIQLSGIILRALKGNEPKTINKIKIDEKLVMDVIQSLKANPEFVKLIK